MSVFKSSMIVKLTLSLILVLLSILPSVKVFATNYQCVWLESDEHVDKFFKKDISFDFNLSEDEQELFLVKDEFLYRTYTPCWVGGFSSCAFGFSYEKEKVWSRDNHYPGNELVFSNSWSYGIAEIRLNIISRENDEIILIMSGDDGDGILFKHEKFICE